MKKLLLNLSIFIILFFFLETNAKSEPSSINLDMGLSFNFNLADFNTPSTSNNFLILNPYLSLNYRPLEKSINVLYKTNISYELKISSYFSSFDKKRTYSLGLGLKKYLEQTTIREEPFINPNIFLILYDTSTTDKNSLQLGASFAFGADMPLFFGDKIKISKKFIIGGSTDFNNGFGVILLPELGVSLDI